MLKPILTLAAVAAVGLAVANGPAVAAGKGPTEAQQQTLASCAGCHDLTPARDTVPKLAQYQENFELTGDHYYLMTGAPATLDQVMKTFRFDFKPDGPEHFQHVNMLAVMDGQGRIVRHFYGLQPNIEQVADTVLQLQKKP